MLVHRIAEFRVAEVEEGALVEMQDKENIILHRKTSCMQKV